MANAKILIVEDESIVARDIQDRLKNLGYDVPAIAFSGEEAIKRVEETKSDLVLMDIVLKGEMDGMEAAKLIRNRFDIPVVYLTAYADEKTLQRAKITEPFGYLRKPFEERELHAAIEMAFYKHDMEKKLKESEKRYRTIFETTGTATVITDEDATIALANTEFERLSGYSKQEIEGKKNWKEFAVKQDLERMKEYSRLLGIEENAAHRSSEFRFVDKYGKVNHVILNIAKIPKTKKSVVSLLDITGRKQAEEALRESEEKFRTIFKSANDLMVYLDESGKILDANKKAVQVLGTSKKGLLGMHFMGLSVFSAGDIPIGKKTILSMCIKNKKGQEIALECSASLMKIRDKLAAVLIIGRDVTNRKKMEKALQDSEEKFRAISTSAKDAIILMDNEEKISYWNPAAERMFGYTKKETIGKELHKFFALDYFHENYMGWFKKFKKPGQSPAVGKTLESVAIRKDGTEFPIELSLSALKTKGKWHAIGIGRDVTERKLAEEEVKKKSKELAYLSRQILKVQEEERKRISRELHDEVEQAIAAVGVNLETLKSSLPGNSEPPRKKLLETKSLLKEIAESVRRISHDLRPAILDDLGLVPALRWYTDRFSKMTNVAVELHTTRIAERLSNASKTVLYRAVQEALTNVLKHSKASSVKIQLKSKDKFVELCVEDNGVGFDAKKVSDTENRKTGLGLLGMRERVKLIGGTVDIIASPGKGIKLLIKIPY